MASGDLVFPNLTRLLRERKSVALEIDGLVRHPYAAISGQYGEGIYLEMLKDRTMFLTERAVDHFGARQLEEPAGGQAFKRIAVRQGVSTFGESWAGVARQLADGGSATARNHGDLGIGETIQVDHELQERRETALRFEMRPP